MGPNRIEFELGLYSREISQFKRKKGERDAWVGVHVL